MNAIDMLPPGLRAWRERSLEWLRQGDPGWDPALDGAWFKGTCDSIVETLAGPEALLPLPAGVRPVMWGGYHCDGIHDAHCWLEWDGPGGAWILDPTSEQYGLEPFAVYAPGDPRRDCYEGPGAHAARSAEGLEVSAP